MNKRRRFKAKRKRYFNKEQRDYDNAIGSGTFNESAEVPEMTWPSKETLAALDNIILDDDIPF